MRTISYKQAINLAIEDEDMVLYLEEIVQNHKNWGQFNVKLPSWVLVNIVDLVKAMAEESLGDRIPVDIDDEDL
jgi:hypothetical protein